MLIERFYLSSFIANEIDGISLEIIDRACNKLRKAAESATVVTVDDLWPGRLHDLSS